jgi:hypothetical protein
MNALLGREPLFVALALSLLAAGLGSGCASTRRRPSDADAGHALDASGTDAAPADAAVMDGAPIDARVIDAGLTDTGTIGPMPDAFVSRDAGRDAGQDASSARDAGTDAGRDAGTDAGRDAGSISGPTIDFPGTGDTSMTMLTNYWNAGDYIEGTRTTMLASITRLMLNVVVTANTLSCDTQDMDVIVNGVTVGTFMISAGESLLTDSFTFAAITGPTYTIRFQTTSTVDSGCGSAGFDLSSSTVTLAP